MQFWRNTMHPEEEKKAQGKLSFFTLSQNEKKVTVNRNFRTSHKSSGSILSHIQVKNTQISQLFSRL
jgi:hypothetical protein